MTSSGSGNTPTAAEKAAEALCRSDNPPDYDPSDAAAAEAYEWDIKAMLSGEDGEYYRRQAAAVLAALDLTVQVRGPFVHGYEQRLVGPWVRVGEETNHE